MCISSLEICIKCIYFVKDFLLGFMLTHGIFVQEKMWWRHLTKGEEMCVESTRLWFCCDFVCKPRAVCVWVWITVLCNQAQALETYKPLGVFIFLLLDLCIVAWRTIVSCNVSLEIYIRFSLKESWLLYYHLG